MSYRPPGTLRVLRLLAWTSVLRLLRAARIRRGQRASKRGVRTATPRKRGDALMLLMVLMLPLFLFQALTITSQAVQRLGTAMQHTSADPDVLLVDERILDVLKSPPRPDDDIKLLAQLAGIDRLEAGNPPPAQILAHFQRRGLHGFLPAPKPPRFALMLVDVLYWPSPVATDAFVGGGSLLLLAMLLMLLAIGFGGANANLAGGEWSQAWLMTFPVATRSLILAKALEYSLVQFFPWLFFCPLLLQLLRALGEPYALPLALLGTLLTTFLTGSLRLWAETWLRLRFSLRTLRSIQGGCTLLALLLMATVFGVCLGESTPYWFVELGRSVPAAVSMLPGSWPLALANGHAIGALPGALLSFAAFALSCYGSARLLRHGAMRTGGVDPGVRGKQGQWAKSTRKLGVVGKDLAMLLRDRNFLVQTMVVPVFVIGLQLVVNPGLGRVQGRGVAMLAYGIGFYSLIGGCFQVLSAEGRALWMLYTLPVSIAEVLRRKVRIWAGTAVGFGTAALLIFSLRAGRPDPAVLLSDLLFVAGGIFSAAHIAAAISILGTDPAADYVPRQPKARHVYLYFFFAGTYFLGLQSQDLAIRMPALLVFATLAFAIWQRACERVPWLLDPVDDHRSGIGVYDGGAAMMVFFALQLFGLLLVTQFGRRPESATEVRQLLAFAVAGAVTVLVFAAILKARGVDLLDGLGLRARTSALAAGKLLLGAGVGAALGGLGLLYVQVARSTGWVEFPDAPTGDRTAILLLAVVAAPLVEEVIFRGLLFQGLLRSVRPVTAVIWSAALFAAVHPFHSWLPVFGLGVATAVVFRRTKFLPAAMLVHAGYNLVVVALQ